MTDATPEPNSADLYALMQQIAASVTQLGEDQRHSEARLTSRLDQLEDRMIDRIAKVREDAAGIKTQLAFEERFAKDAAEAIRRHLGRHLEGDEPHRHAA